MSSEVYICEFCESVIVDVCGQMISMSRTIDITVDFNNVLIGMNALPFYLVYIIVLLKRPNIFDS
jgi:hypothetical protein